MTNPTISTQRASFPPRSSPTKDTLPTQLSTHLFNSLTCITQLNSLSQLNYQNKSLSNIMSSSLLLTTPSISTFQNKFYLQTQTSSLTNLKPIKTPPKFGLFKPTHVVIFPKRFNISRKFTTFTSIRDDAETSTSDSVFSGEDSAAFDLDKQKISSWIYFSLVLGVVLFVLNVVWIDNSTGFGKAYIDSVSSFSDSPEVVMLLLTVIFAAVHSGLASLRDVGEKLIGERAYRVLFAGVSLPLAVSTIVYFINHRYDGAQLWDLQSVPTLHQLVWLSNFISFFFLYPSTFNLLEVAAVDKPKMHLWETGIMRITRHPQMVGQVIWCLAHTLWIGNSVAVAASVGLIGHHLLGVWNGDRRLAVRYGENFEAVKQRTSVIPFAAILDGRQKLPKDYYKEFIRLPYLAITALTLGAYFAHPLMQSASFGLHW